MPNIHKHDETVDVVIPVYNGEYFLDGCLNSVLNQSVAVKNIYVVNDGSSDGTQSLAEEWTKKDTRIKVINLPRSGLPAARNAGIRRCESYFIAVLDVDDVWLPDKLKLQLQVFQNSSELPGLVYCAADFIDIDGEPKPSAPVCQPTLRGYVFSELLHRGNVISGSASAALIPREVFSEVGLFDETLTFAEDWGMWLQISKRYKMDYCDEILVHICEYPGSLNREHSYERLNNRFRNLMQVRIQHKDSLTWTKEIRKIMLIDCLRIWRISRYKFSVLKDLKLFLESMESLPSFLTRFFYFHVSLRVLLLFIKFRSKKILSGK